METNETDRINRQAQMLANKVKKRYRHLRKRYARQNLEIFRLYDWDIPDIRAVVDWYGGHLVVGEYSRQQSTPDWLPLMGSAVAAALNVSKENLHLKIRKSGIKDGTRYKRLNHTNQKIPMWERELQFYINPSDYVDTGLFSDHRNTRQRVGKMVNDKDFLNLYCYTGAFTCYAAKGGARSTLSVDRSETAVNWAQENLALNKLTDPRHTLVQEDTLDFLARAKGQHLSFDLAVVDPPSYSTTQETQQHFDIARDYPVLLNGVFELMRPGGTLFFSTNHQNFDMETHRLTAANITEITDQTIPEDYLTKRKKIHRCWEMQV
jgi:23S rRNA (cytosine1962-C5)-methyltransferase